MYLFRKTVFDCKQATLLSIRKDEGRITLFERVKLSYHLMYCDPCRRFIKQWDLLNAKAKNDTPFAKEPRFSLSPASREKIQSEIARHL